MMKKRYMLTSLLLVLSACMAAQNQQTQPSLDSTLPPPQLDAQPPSDPVEDSGDTAQPTELPTLQPSPTIPPASIPDPQDYLWLQVAEGFVQPLFVTNAGDGSNRLFVVGQHGVIWLIQNGAVLETPFLDIRGRVGSQWNEQGLLGLAFHPQYGQNGYFYLNYTDVNGDTVISRFQVSLDPSLADPSSESILLQVDQPFANHNGGQITFGSDNRLYIGLGDGGSAGNAQAPDRLLGSILRIDVDNQEPYGIPADNPFVKEGGRPEVWHYGLRNPWRFSFDNLTNDLYIADVGQNIWEEIHFLPAASPGGANFGWNYFEGSHEYGSTPPEGLDLIPPVAEYAHSGGRCSVTGGHVYRGAALPAWQGVYIYGDFCSGEIFALALVDAQWQNQLVFDLNELITSFGLDEQGELYLVGRSGGLFRLSEK